MNKYKNIALDLLNKYCEAKLSLIYKYSGNFDKSKNILYNVIVKYLIQLDEEKLINKYKNRIFD